MNWPQAAIPLGSVLTVRYGKASAASDRDEDGPYPVVGSAGEMARTHRPLALNPAIVIGRKGNVGQSHYFDGGCWPTDTTFYVEPGPNIDPRFLLLQLEHLNLKSLDRSTATPSLRREDLEAQPVVLPLVPDQRRIVAILEEHLSDLDDGVRSLRKAEMRCRLMKRSVMLDLIPEAGSWPARWRCGTVAAVGSVELGRQRHPDWHHGPNMHPYLRVANVFEDRIDTSDLMEMHWPEDTFDRFKLRPGQILLNEGQSPQYLGRPAMYRGEPAEVAFTNSLLRFTAGPDALPEFALLVFRRHMHAGRFAKESRITTNIAHLSASRLKSVEFPVPPLAEQKDLVNLARERLEAVSRIEGSIQAKMRRAAGLRRAVLAAAFSGRLTGHGSDTDVISELTEEESA